MGWPKGVPRKGYVKKDSTKPRRKKAELPPPLVVPAEPEFHGYVGNQPVTEVCPNCLYVYADGGYCSDCGWTAPITLDEWGTNSGSNFR
jgi:hypothetical protein